MMITGRGFTRPSLWFMGGFGLWVVCGLWLWGSGVRVAVWFRLLPSSYVVLGCFCSGRGCNSISVFLWHCLCVVLVYVNAFN